ncbi:MAG: hypothetical protein DI582_00240 [Azospirillum brasilense]|nr:MAG: hypothetical protein DI582_00240 [Azospirillum brasilense]
MASTTRWHPRACLPWISYAGLLLSVLAIWQLARNPLQEFLKPIGADFFNVWAAPRVAAQDITALFDIGRYMATIRPWFDTPLATRNWSYPLYDLFFYAPFAWLPYGLALAVWSVGGLAAYLLVSRPLMPRTQSLLPILCLGASPFVLVNLTYGQNGFLTAVLSLGALLTLPRRPWLAGVLIGLLCIKPHFGLLWPAILLGLGAWRSFAAATVTVLACAGASLAVHGVEAWQLYLQHAGPVHMHFAAATPEQGMLRNFQLMMLSPFTSLRLLQLPFTLAMGVQLVLSLLVMLACAWGFRRHTALLPRALLLGSASLLVTPYAFNYDAGVLTAALLAWFAHSTTATPRGQIALFAAGLLLPVWVMPLNGVFLPVAPLCLLLIFTTAFHMRPLTA